MNASTMARTGARPTVEQALVAFAGIIHLLTGVATLLTPGWFFQKIGTFPPYNRHYEGDLGAFQIGLAVGLLWAARDPARYRLVIIAAAVGNLVHALNHTYDALVFRAPLSYWLSDTAPLYLFALVLIILSTGALGRAR